MDNINILLRFAPNSRTKYKHLEGSTPVQCKLCKNQFRYCHKYLAAKHELFVYFALLCAVSLDQTADIINQIKQTCLHFLLQKNKQKNVFFLVRIDNKEQRGFTTHRWLTDWLTQIQRLVWKKHCTLYLIITKAGKQELLVLLHCWT